MELTIYGDMNHSCSFLAKKLAKRNISLIATTPHLKMRERRTPEMMLLKVSKINLYSLLFFLFKRGLVTLFTLDQFA